MTVKQRKEMIAGVDNLAIFFAKKWYYMIHYSKIEIIDLIQSARVGIIKAADSYMSFRGTKFSYWAALKIKAELQHWVDKAGGTVHVPHRKCKVLQLHYESDDDQLNSIPVESNIEEVDAKCDAPIILKELEEYEQQILQLRYIEGATYIEIAKVMNCSREWAKTLTNQAKDKLLQSGKLSPCSKCNWKSICEANNITICPRDHHKTHFSD